MTYEPESCRRCGRLKAAGIHDTIGRQGTGTAAVHPFTGDREIAILEHAAAALGWSKKSRPHARRPTAEIAQWNDAIEAAREVVRNLALPISPNELSDYDKYFGDHA